MDICLACQLILQFQTTRCIMKAKLFILLTLLVLLFTSDISNAKRRGVSDYFYSNLNSHGKWIELSDGLVVWRPFDSFGRWTPYARGKWIWSNYGWYWDSFEPYGHIVYHYGRWYFDDYYGWLWIPDYEWGPSWVEWRYDDDYVGWAPLPPYAVYSYSTGIRYTKSYIINVGWWKFVYIKHFNSPSVYNHFVSKKYRDKIYKNTKSFYDYGYERERIINRGIDPRLVETRSKTKIRESEIVRSASLMNDRDPVTRSSDRIEIRQPLDVRSSELRDLKIERSSRKSNLDMANIEIGRNTEKREIINESVKSGETRQTVGENARLTETRQTVREDTPTPRGNTKIERTSIETKRNIDESRTGNVDRKIEPRVLTPVVKESVRQFVPESRLERNTEVRREPESRVQVQKAAPKREEVNIETRTPQTQNRTIERSSTVRNSSPEINRSNRESKPETRTSTSERNSSRESNEEKTIRRR